MGNLIHFSTGTAVNYLIRSIDPCHTFLLYCNLNSGSKADLEKLYRNYMKFHFGKNFFCVKSELKRMSKFTKIENYEDLIFNYFSSKSFSKVNIMEIFAAVVSFSGLALTEKIKFGFKLFDFDNNDSISEDELFIMFKCFIDAIALLTNGRPCANYVISQFIQDSRKENLALDELVEWVKSNQNISVVLSQTSETGLPKPQILASKIHKSFDSKIKRPGIKKRSISSFTQKKDMNSMIVVDSVPVTKLQLLKLKEIYEALAISDPPLGLKLKEKLKKNQVKQAEFLSDSGEYPTFRHFLLGLYPKAEKHQIKRMLYLLKRNNYLVLVPKAKKEPKVKINPSLERYFKKLDLNGDGVLDLSELKSAFVPKFSDNVIEELFKDRIKNNPGLNISDFTEMFEPSSK